MNLFHSFSNSLSMGAIIELSYLGLVIIIILFLPYYYLMSIMQSIAQF